MRKPFVLLLILSLLFMSSCSRSACSGDIAYELLRICPDGARVYSSLSEADDEGYIDEPMLYTLYGNEHVGVSDFSIILYGGVTSPREIGIFIARTGDDRINLFEIATERIAFLSSFADGEGFVKKYHGVFVYGFVDDALGFEKALDAIL